jgi:hypothetical protein
MEPFIPEDVYPGRRDYSITSESVEVCVNCNFEANQHYPAEITITLCAECFDKTYPIISEEESAADDEASEESGSEEAER